jgi:hypothetical protein
MYYVHHFAHHDTLRRACDWLDQFGFHPDRPTPGEADAPWLTLSVETSQLAEVELLVNAAENTDPLGWPSFWEEARQGYSRTELSSDKSHRDHARGGKATIGWHPIDDVDALDRAEVEWLREVMGR